MMTDSNEELARSLNENYDLLAEEYARHLFHELENKPFDQEILKRFSKEVSGEVCDMGCGPGQVARYLRDLNVEIFGLDISERMLEEARKLNPDIHFEVGNVLSLALPEASLSGTVAFYLICNIPRDSLPQLFQEMMRVLMPGGLLLISFHNGDNETIHENERWCNLISLDSFLYRPSFIRKLLEEGGFHIEDIVERDPYPPDVEYQSQRTYIFARK
jgi:SAM-dependent methyltransferase